MKKKDNKVKVDNLYFDDTELDIPEDQIYDYQIEGLSAPHINKPYSHFRAKKLILILVIIVAVSLSIFFSVRVVHSDVFSFDTLESETYKLTKFSNTNNITELTINYVSDIEYDRTNTDPKTNFTITADETKPVTEIGPYAFNCDGVLQKVYIGENVEKIDGKAFYSCWAIKAFEVDENNPNYCDVDGVLYTKDKTTVVCYPCDHDQYLREKYGYSEELNADCEDQELFAKYKKEVMTYVIPSSVTTVGELCFNYANLAVVYFPEGLKKIETLGFFEMPNMSDFYTYKPQEPVTETDITAVEGLETYLSFPDTLEYIGSDAFSYNQSMNYVFIPKSVTYIGHHAFWDTVYTKDGDTIGVRVINVELDEDSFRDSVETGDQWVPQYNKNLLKKIPVEYSCTRKTAE
ncbi:MAG: leucine-rich repeat protein [Acutalibacteraceae bacterium]